MEVYGFVFLSFTVFILRTTCMALQFSSRSYTTAALSFDVNVRRIATIADCAVCKDNYAPGIAHSCHKCSGRSLGSAVGLVLLTLMVILGGLAVAVAYLVALVRVGGSAEEEQEAPRGCWKWRLGSCHSFLRKVFPVTSMKVIVVVWQILTQVNVVLDTGKCLGCVVRPNSLASIVSL